MNDHTTIQAAKLRLVSWDELCSWPEPTHMMKDWGAVFDPMRPLDQPLMQEQFDRCSVHDADFNLFARFQSAKQFVDIGANCGQSIVSLRAINPNLPIVSFEPNPICYRLLVGLGGRLPHVRAYPFGLSDEDAFLTLYTPVVDRLLITPLASMQADRFDSGLMGDWLVAHAGASEAALYGETLAFMKGDNFNLTPDIIKIDAEGAELIVLRGLAKTITNHKPLIMLEKGDHHPIHQFLSGLGYDSFTFDQTSQGRLIKLPINPETTVHELPLNVFYVHADCVTVYQDRYGLEFVL